MSKFNVRVYALIINENKEILLSDEIRNGYSFTKFPGGGIEFGEGILDGLKREILEELNSEIENAEFFYFNDFFQKSVLSNEDQIIAFYYLVTLKNPYLGKENNLDFNKNESQTLGNIELFRWADIHGISSSDLSFPIDKEVMLKLKDRLNLHKL